MIQIEHKEDCCGCSACAQICPKQCITMTKDEEGFLYPKVNQDDCIHCQRCIRTCPLLHHQEAPSHQPAKVYAAYNQDESVRKESSSGGIFTALALQILQEDGIVYGAAFDSNWQVYHTGICREEELKLLRGSKYVQSDIKNSFQEIRTHLKNKRKVLFTGTPCQITGLKRYLKKDDDNLLTLEIVCHGVPSPDIWQRYLKEKFSANGPIKDITFRNKDHGWSHYQIAITTEKTTYRSPGYDDLYMKGFLKHFFLRPSCYQCRCKQGKSQCDISVGDYWSINQSQAAPLNDDKGISCIHIFTNKGITYFNKCKEIKYQKTTYDESIAGNGGFYLTHRIPKERDLFLKKINNQSVISVIEKLSQEKILVRIKRYIKRILH